MRSIAPLHPGQNDIVTSKDRLTRCFLEARDDLLRFLTRRIGRRATAEDIAQEAWIKLHEHHERDSWREPRAVLFATAANLATDTQRHEARVARTLARALHEADGICSRSDPQHQLDTEEQLDDLASALNALPAACREAFLLYRLESLTHGEIAARLGVSTKSVQRYIERAMRHCLQVKQS